MMADSNSVSEKMENATIEDKQNTAGDTGDDFVDPWNVSSHSQTGIDYNKLISEC